MLRERKSRLNLIHFFACFIHNCAEIVSASPFIEDGSKMVNEWIASRDITVVNQDKRFRFQENWALLLATREQAVLCLSPHPQRASKLYHIMIHMCRKQIQRLNSHSHRHPTIKSKFSGSWKGQENKRREKGDEKFDDEIRIGHMRAMAKDENEHDALTGAGARRRGENANF